MIKKIYLSMKNCGDGSVYAKFFEDEDCAFMHQRLQEEGWGEDCVQELTLSSDSEITIHDNVLSKQDYIDELQETIDDSWTKEKRKKQLQNAILLLTGAFNADDQVGSQ